MDVDLVLEAWTTCRPDGLQVVLKQDRLSACHALLAQRVPNFITEEEFIAEMTRVCCVDSTSGSSSTGELRSSSSGGRGPSPPLPTAVGDRSSPRPKSKASAQKQAFRQLHQSPPPPVAPAAAPPIGTVVLPAPASSSRRLREDTPEDRKVVPASPPGGPRFDFQPAERRSPRPTSNRRGGAEKSTSNRRGGAEKVESAAPTREEALLQDVSLKSSPDESPGSPTGEGSPTDCGVADGGGIARQLKKHTPGHEDRKVVPASPAPRFDFQPGERRSPRPEVESAAPTREEALLQDVSLKSPTPIICSSDEENVEVLEDSKEDSVDVWIEDLVLNLVERAVEDHEKEPFDEEPESHRPSNAAAPIQSAGGEDSTVVVVTAADKTGSKSSSTTSDCVLEHPNTSCSSSSSGKFGAGAPPPLPDDEEPPALPDDEDCSSTTRPEIIILYNEEASRPETCPINSSGGAAVSAAAAREPPTSSEEEELPPDSSGTTSHTQPRRNHDKISFLLFWRGLGQVLLKSGLWTELSDRAKHDPALACSQNLFLELEIFRERLLHKSPEKLQKLSVVRAEMEHANEIASLETQAFWRDCQQAGDEWDGGW